MYGMVNRALKALLCEQFGESTWHEIRSKAGVEEDDFASMKAYDDSITYDLAGAASEVLDTPVDDLLRAFGNYWVKFAGESSYAILLDQAGDTLSEILTGLDEMHTRLALAFPELRAPSFQVVSDDGKRITLRYVSSRPALVPFVCGLIEGLATRLGVKVAVDLMQPKSDSNPSDILSVTLLAH
jgi:hypothetical protein